VFFDGHSEESRTQSINFNLGEGGPTNEDIIPLHIEKGILSQLHGEG